MSDILQEGNSLTPDTYVELFDFDATILGDTVYYFTNTPTGGGVNPLIWRGNSYFPFPLELSGVTFKSDGTAPSRPTLSMSAVEQNGTKFLLALVLSLGDLVGMKVTRWRTVYKFTDNGSEPNPVMHYPVQEWILVKKLSQSRTMIQFELASPLELPGLKLPKKQILRDFGFPGVGRVRFR